ncbi:MAG: helix-turn-helix domain-containing protein [Bryobacteraceae bacterium]
MTSTESNEGIEKNELDTLPEALMHLRNKLGWTQQQLALSLGVALRTIVRWEQGDSAIGYENLVKLLAIAKLNDHPEVIPRFIDGCPREMKRLIDLETLLQDPNWAPPDPHSRVKTKAPERRNQKRRKIGRSEALARQKLWNLAKFVMNEINTLDKARLEIENGQPQLAAQAVCEVGTGLTERLLNEFSFTEQDKERLRRMAPSAFLRFNPGNSSP